MTHDINPAAVGKEFVPKRDSRLVTFLQSQEMCDKAQCVVHLALKCHPLVNSSETNQSTDRRMPSSAAH